MTATVRPCLLLLAGLSLISLLGHRALCWAAEIEPPSDGVEFDGQTAYTVPAEAVAMSPLAITVCAWVKLRTTDASQVFLSRGRANNVFTFYLYRDGVRMLVGHNAPEYARALAPRPEADAWTHYTGSYDGKTIRIYVNGALEATAPAPGEMETAEDDLMIGALNERERFLDGRMEDVRLWRRTLSDEEIAAVAAGKTDGSLNQGLAGRWTKASTDGRTWNSLPPGSLTATQVAKAGIMINGKYDGYRGVWYCCGKSENPEYVYKYSGGLGTYCAKHIPHAWYVKEANKTFFTYGGARDGTQTHLVHMVSHYDHATGRVPRPTILLDKETTDAHDNPVISVDDDGHIWVFSSSHGTARPSYISRSTAPYSVDRFKLVWTGNYSYPQPAYLSGKGWLLMHTYYEGGRTIRMMTSPDGVDWSERRLLSRIHQGHYEISRPYKNVKVGSAFNYHPNVPRVFKRTNLYYMETRDVGETWTNAQGEPLDMPLTEPDNPALVHDYKSEGLNVYMKDISYDAKGNPIILHLTSGGNEPGPENMPRTWRTARWTGAEWDIQGGDIISDNNYDTGSLYIESERLWRIIGPTEVGPQQYNSGGEVAMWVSRDMGKTWKMVRQMTVSSEYNHGYVRRPVNAHPDFYGFWADGHGREVSESRLYFCNKNGDVFRLPKEMTEDFAEPERID